MPIGQNKPNSLLPNVTFSQQNHLGSPHFEYDSIFDNHFLQSPSYTCKGWGGKFIIEKNIKALSKQGDYYAPNKKNNMVVFGFFSFVYADRLFSLPPVLKMILVKKLSENLHRQVTIQKIKINPYALTVDVKGFLVKERGSAENFVSFDEIFVESLKPLPCQKSGHS